MTSLPTFFVLQAYPGHPYLCARTKAHANLPSPDLLCFDQGYIIKPDVKFAAEQSKTGDDPTLVHIRSCFNNKYLVHKPIGGKFHIVASADKPEEDTTKATCTLFRTFADSTSDGTPGFKLLSVSTSMYLYPETLLLIDNDEAVILDLSSKSGGHTFLTVDWQTVVILPREIAFRSEDLNSNYLCSRVQDKYYNYHKFESGLDIGHERVGHELEPNEDGNYRIRDLFFGKFWRGVPDWIWADTYKYSKNPDIMFSFVKLSDNVVAMRCLSNNKFCGAVSRDGKKHCLRAEYSTISKETRLIVEDRALRREISNVRYRDAMTYDLQGGVHQELGHQYLTNDSPDKEDTFTIEFSETATTTLKWNNSVSVEVGTSVSIGFELGEAPFLLKEQVELSTKFGSSTEWGKDNTIEETRKNTYTVVVPKLSKKKVTHKAKKVVYEIPFSYKERVLLRNGAVVINDKEDGILTGTSHDFYIESENI